MRSKRNEVPPKALCTKTGKEHNEKIDPREIKAELEKPNGSAEIMNDSTIDKISLCDETTGNVH